MSLKNGNTVERRMDLASLFCMIGRHGPAVALAVIAVVSVLAGFVLYQTVRGKRRKTRVGGDGSPGEERDEGLVQTEEPEEPRSSTEEPRSFTEEPRSFTEEPRSFTEEPRSFTESTDVSDEGSSDDDLKIRHHRSTAEQKPPPSPPPEKDPLLDNSSAVQDEAAENNKGRETCTVADVKEDGWNQGDGLRDVDEDDGRRSKLQLTDHQSYKEEEKVLPAECQEDVTADKDHYDEDNLQNILESPVCCEQKLHMCENRERDDEGTADTNKTESHLEEPVVHIEDVRVSSVCYSKDPENHPEDTSHSKYYSNDLLSPEEETKNEEVVDEQVIVQQAEAVYSTSEQETNQSDVLSSQNSDQDHECGQTSDESQEDVQEDLLSSLPDVHFDAHMLQQHLQTEQNHGEGLTWNEGDDIVKGDVLSDVSSEVEGEETTPVLDKDAVLDVPAPDLTSLKKEFQSENTETRGVVVLAEGDQLSSQQEQCDVKAEVVLSGQESDQREDCGLTSETTEDLKEDHLNDLTDVGFEQQLQIEQKDGLPSNQEDGVVKGQMLASCDEECESSNVALTPALPEKFDSSDDGLSGATTDAEAQISGVVDFPDLPSDHQQPQREEEEITPVLHRNAHLDVPASDLPSLKEEIQSEKNQGSVDQEGNPPSSQLEQRDEVTAEESDQNDDCGLNSKPIEDMNKGHLNDLTNVRFDSSTRQQQLQTELQSDFTSNQEDGVVKDEILTSVDEEQEPEKTDGVCGTTGEPRCVDFPELSSDFPLSVKEDEAAPALDINADLNTLGLDVSSVKEEIQSERKEIDTAVVLAEETVDKVMSSSYKDQHSDPMDNKESLGKMGDQPVLSTETSHPDISSFFQDKQSDQNNADLPEVTAGAAPVINKPPICQVQLPSFEQSELTLSSSGFGGESGVSSMTVSPDMENPINECVLIPENADLPVEDCDPLSEVQTEAQMNLSADDVALSVANEDAAGMMSESCPSHLSLQPHDEPTDWTKDESFSSNEDTFGHEVEDSYNRAMDQFLEEIAAEVKHDEKKKQTDVKDIETKQNEAAKEEEEEEYEKTEISIMEATMDNNEWITDGNYQVLPWMNCSVPSFTQSHTKTEAVPREERLHSSSPAEAPCIDAVIPLPVNEQTNTVSLLDESLENSKKVVAVQPMPQNVNVIFRIHYHTHSPYQKVAVTGNQQELGNWKEFIPLERAEDGQWSSVVSLPAESHVEWKFVVVDKGDVCRWEECGNRLLDTGSGDDLLVHRWWGIL
ncbi:enolase-phosphatase E1 [Amphiprion ocellaris]|uniref:enolase-phosphatase E1 n=1 Tax=Amphiprion ocellaris TaxID=80972 RepID=UPI000C30FC9B|nr:enolase-phosphatase E1 [Amphiprion ocellaris]